MGFGVTVISAIFILLQITRTKSCRSHCIISCISRISQHAAEGKPLPVPRLVHLTVAQVSLQPEMCFCSQSILSYGLLQLE